MSHPSTHSPPPLYMFHCPPIFVFLLVVFPPPLVFSICVSPPLPSQDPAAALATDLGQLSLSGGGGASAVGSVGSIGGAGGGRTAARVTASRAGGGGGGGGGMYAGGPGSRAVQGQSFSLQDVRKGGGPGPASQQRN